jgi:hypothetical protein
MITTINGAEVFVVLAYGRRGEVVGLEVLDTVPAWDTAQIGQRVYAANVNGGDSELVR